MKIGTDAMLLGSLSQPGDAQNILDIGTGTGVLALMLAQRCPLAIIDGVEIDRNAAQRAIENFENSPWSHRLTLYNEDVQHYTNTGVILYEYIICNPPYFEPSPTTRPDRVNARSTVSLTHENLLIQAEKLLDARGTLGIIVPETEGEKIITLAGKVGLGIKRQVLIRSFKNQPIIRRVIEFSRHPKEHLEEEDFVIYNDDKTWSAGYKQLTAEFHYIEPRL